MNTFLRESASCFSAGSAGGLANSAVVWVVGAIGVTAALGVNIAPTFSADWLYPRIVWGGLWGFLFLAPALRGSLYARGLLWSLGPTAVQLLIIFPLVAKKGVFGMELGTLTPLLVCIFNAVWGLTAAAILARIKREPVAASQQPQ